MSNRNPTSSITLTQPHETVGRCLSPATELHSLSHNRIYRIEYIEA